MTVPSFDFARKYPDAAAIAFLGTAMYREKWPAQDYYVLCADGTLAMLEIYGTYVASEDRVGYTLRQKTVGNVGKKFANDKGLSMTYVNDGVNEGLIVAYSDGAAELYYIDLQAEILSIGKLGNVGKATAISAPYVTTNPPESAVVFGIREGTAEICSTPVSFGQSFGVEVPITDVTTDTAGGGEAPAAGSLNAIRATGEQTEAPNGAAGDSGKIRLTLTESQAVTNGLIQIQYDAGLLTYEGMDSVLGNTAIAVDTQAGRIAFAYATASPVQAGDPLAALQFSYAGEYISTNFQVTTLQRNGDLDLAETVDLPVTQEDGGHSYVLAEAKDPTCTEAGWKRYACEKCGGSYTEPVPALGHDFGSWEITKAADCFQDGQESRRCNRCGETQVRSIPASQTNCPSTGFSDLYASAWYHPYTDFVLRQELMVGVGGGRFAPNGAVTRAMVVTILYRMAGSPEVETASTFRDVPENAWYAPAVSWTQSQGIALGVTAERFAPEATATREQLVTFLYRYGAYVDMAEGGDLSPYPDGSAVAGYAAGAMAWAVGAGIVEGDETGRLLPKATATRAQMAAMVTRFLK